MTSIEERIKKSSDDFVRLVWPVIGRGFGSVIPVETVSENVFASELDRRSGIDAWLIDSGQPGHMRGLASRVQPRKSMTYFDTFTIRVRSRWGQPTEYHKRLAEIEANERGRGGVMSPYYVTQGYVTIDEPQLVAAAIARMRDVIEAVTLDLGHVLPRNADGTQGYVVHWADLAAKGYPIRRWVAPDARLMVSRRRAA